MTEYTEDGWELVDQPSDEAKARYGTHTFRLQVPGGWIYRIVEHTPGHDRYAWQCMYVPEPPT
jgi:hypothetical protein